MHGEGIDRLLEILEDKNLSISIRSNDYEHEPE
jgi:hypothetical protein